MRLIPICFSLTLLGYCDEAENYSFADQRSQAGDEGIEMGVEAGETTIEW